MPPPRELVLSFVDAAAKAFDLMNKDADTDKHTELDRKMRDLYEKLRASNDDTPYRDLLKDIHALVSAVHEFKSPRQVPPDKLS